MNKISENNNCQPVNYYGLSKLACENIINYTNIYIVAK